MNRKEILNEELQRMKYLFCHNRGVVISEQEVSQNTETPTEDIPFEDPKTEEELNDEQAKDVAAAIDEIGTKIEGDLGGKLLKNLKDPKILNGIATAFAFNNSKKFVPKDFYKEPFKYKFVIYPVTYMGIENVNLDIQMKDLTTQTISYTDTAGKYVFVNQNEIIEDINATNQYNFSNGVDGQYGLRYQFFKDKDNKRVKGLQAYKTTSNLEVDGRGRLIILGPGVFTPKLSSPEGAEVTTGVGTKQFVKKPTEYTIRLKGGELQAGSNSKFSFAVESHDLSQGSDKTIIDEIKRLVSEDNATKHPNKTDKYIPILTGLKIISSASNKYGPNDASGVVTPTHDNNGNPANNNYNTPVDYKFGGKTIKTNQQGSSPQKNYELAKRRGETLSNVVLNNLNNLGIEMDDNINTVYDIRITDTGGRVDKPGSGLNVGQFAEILLSVDYKEKKETPGAEGAAVSFTQFVITLEKTNIGGGGKNKEWSLDLQRAKYTNSGIMDKLIKRIFGNKGGVLGRRKLGTTNFLMRKTNFSGRFGGK